MSRRVIDLLTVRVGADMHEVLEGFEAIGARADKIGRKMSRVGRSLTAGITIPLAAVGAASVKMASDAEEAANKFDVVMGSSAASARAELRALMRTIPATSAEMEGMAAGLQDLLVPMGVARQEAAGMSVDMVRLAGDIASFNNVLPTEALDAMRSALAGESEPMRRFGVDTRVTRLEALALKEGLIGLGQELDETARAQAVMLAIMQDSTDAMGDAERTVESTANQMKFFARDVKQLAIEIGGVLIPAVQPLIASGNDLLGVLRGMDRETMQAVAAIGLLAAAIGPAILVAGAFVSSIGSIVGGFVALNAVLATGGIAAMIAGGGVITAMFLAAGAVGALAGKIIQLNREAEAIPFDRIDSVLGRAAHGSGPVNLNALAGAAHGAGVAAREADEGAKAFAETLDRLNRQILPVTEPLVKLTAVGVQRLSIAEMEAKKALVHATDALTKKDLVAGKFTATMTAAATAQERLNSALGKAQGLLGAVASAMSGFGIAIPGLSGITGVLSSIPVIGGLFGGGGKAKKFAGGFATGGHIPAGQFGLVAEAGRAEVVSSPTFVRGPANVAPMDGAGDNVFHVSFVTPDGRQVADTLTYRQKRGENLNRVIHLPVQVATG